MCTRPRAARPGLQINTALMPGCRPPTKISQATKPVWSKAFRMAPLTAVWAAGRQLRTLWTNYVAACEDAGGRTPEQAVEALVNGCNKRLSLLWRSEVVCWQPNIAMQHWRPSPSHALCSTPSRVSSTCESNRPNSGRSFIQFNAAVHRDRCVSEAAFILTDSSLSCSPTSL